MLSDPILRKSALIALGHIGVFFASIICQVVGKVKAMNDHKAKKAKAKSENSDVAVQPFDRYHTDHPLLLQTDRMVGNWMEWSVSFQVVFWLHQILCDAEKGVSLGWLYVIARAAYIPCALLGGIDRRGAKPTIFLSTLPAYYALFAMFWSLVSELLK
eukprot:TRINITY_DN5784_c0_g1_i3.p1 TRINITY_DN5784_c0_g1~~TRINITY_DN5784_c0_g1_i3.p1  ORF type:complete len:158 (+),score=54.02 TRINITY_DN5784_c0_g1_i3:110-583(+)